MFRKPITSLLYITLAALLGSALATNPAGAQDQVDPQREADLKGLFARHYDPNSLGKWGEVLTRERIDYASYARLRTGDSTGMTHEFSWSGDIGLNKLGYTNGNILYEMAFDFAASVGPNRLQADVRTSMPLALWRNPANEQFLGGSAALRQPMAVCNATIEQVGGALALGGDPLHEQYTFGTGPDAWSIAYTLSAEQYGIPGMPSAVLAIAESDPFTLPDGDTGVEARMKTVSILDGGMDTLYYQATSFEAIKAATGERMTVESLVRRLRLGTTDMVDVGTPRGALKAGLAQMQPPTQTGAAPTAADWKKLPGWATASINGMNAANLVASAAVERKTNPVLLTAVVIVIAADAVIRLTTDTDLKGVMRDSWGEIARDAGEAFSSVTGVPVDVDQWESIGEGFGGTSGELLMVTVTVVVPAGSNADIVVELLDDLTSGAHETEPPPGIDASDVLNLGFTLMGDDELAEYGAVVVETLGAASTFFGDYAEGSNGTCVDGSETLYQGTAWYTGSPNSANDVTWVTFLQPAVLDLSRQLAMNRVDVFFLADNTGSMVGEIAEVRNRAQAILDALAGSDPRFADVDIHWGVGRYSDDQITVPGNPGYELIQPITGVSADVASALAQWNSTWGAGTESAFWALQQAATDGEGTPRHPTNPLVATGQETGWREDAARVIVLFGDEPSRQESINEQELREILLDLGVHVSVIDSGAQDGGSGSSWDATSGEQLTGAAQEIADGTGGAYIELLETDDLVAAILHAVYDAITANDRTGGYIASVESGSAWRARTPSSVEVSTPDDGDTFDITIRRAGWDDADVSIDMTSGTTSSEWSYLETTNITGTADIFGLDLSAGALSQFTPDKDFLRFVFSDENGRAVEGWHGLRATESILPTSGITLMDLATRSDSPFDGDSYSTGDLDMRLSINWQSGAVFGVDLGTPDPTGDGIGVFIGVLDPATGRIDGRYVAKTPGTSGVQGIADSARGNTNMQLYGENAAIGAAGVFSVDWLNDSFVSAAASMSMIGFALPGGVVSQPAAIADGDVWNGFAAAMVIDGPEVSAAMSDSSDDVRFVFDTGNGQVDSSVQVTDGSGGDHSLSLGESQSVFASGQAFGAVETENALAHIATTTSGLEQYDYTSWGSWSSTPTTGGGGPAVHTHSPWIAGNLTPGANIPTMATATYSGPAWGLLNEPSGVTNVTGTTSLTANFGTNTLTGGLNNMTRADGSQWANLTINGQWGAGVNAISGSIAADNGMSGAMNGAFFGPSAQEIGGNWSVSGSGSSAAGVFVGK